MSDQNNTSMVKSEPTYSQRFTQRVIAEFATVTSDKLFDLNDKQRRIIQGYFVVIDRALKAAEEERTRKNANNNDHKYDNLIPYNWSNINMTDLAFDAVRCARMGLDMQEKNHLFPIPYANKKTGLYDITFMQGYGGIQYIADNYAADPPQSVTIEIIYSNDVFKPIKKSAKNPGDNYEFDIVSPFDRGEIVGGFGFIEYDIPSKNKLIMMSKAQMDKRKPKYASANFWGGIAKEWVKGKQECVEKEGWQDEMYRKTLVREVYSGKHIPRDPAKIDNDYQYLMEREVVYAQLESDNNAQENANKTPIDLPPPTEPEASPQSQPTDEPPPEPPPTESGYTPPEI